MQLIVTLFTLSALAPTVLTASTEHQKLRRAPGSKKPNGYIVKLKDGVPREKSIASLTGLPTGSDELCEIGYSHWTRE